MCTSLLEVCTRKGDTTRALAMYDQMRDAPAGSRLAPSVHAYTAAMRAAADGGAWEKALCIWSDMVAAGCQPTGPLHACNLSCMLYYVRLHAPAPLFGNHMEKCPTTATRRCSLSAHGAGHSMLAAL